jgi:molybdopterin-binding protein
MPTAYRPSQAAELLGVSVDTVRRWADAGKLKIRRSRGGQRLIDGADLARFLEAQGGIHDPGAVVGQSARNRFPGIVTRVVRDKVTAQVEIHAGPHRIVSLMTREAADELGLEPGVLAVAAVKSTNVVVEVTRPPASAAES